MPSYPVTEEHKTIAAALRKAGNIVLNGNWIQNYPAWDKDEKA